MRRQGVQSVRRLAGAATFVVVFAGAIGVALGHPAQRRGVRAVAPSLALVSRSPATVLGRHFRPRVAVRMTLHGSRSLTLSARPDARGTFTVVFAEVLDRCSGWSVSARQPGRALVSLRGGPQPECAPAGAS